MVIFLYNLYFFVWTQHGFLTNIVYALDPNSSVIKRWCISLAGLSDLRIRLPKALIFQNIFGWVTRICRPVVTQEVACSDLRLTQHSLVQLWSLNLLPLLSLCLLLLEMVYSWEYNVYATQELCSEDICRLSINRTFMGFIDHAQTKIW